MSVKKFDKTAFTYDCKPMHVERAKAVADAIKRIVPMQKDWKLADFGCGTGLLGFNFVDDVREIDMIDLSENMLSVLKEKLESLQLSNMNPKLVDILDENIPIDEYDMVITLMTFHHIEDLKGVLERLSSMLKPAGYLAIADLEEEDGTYHQDGDTVHNGINQKMLKQLATESGLKFIQSDIPYIIRKKVRGINREYPVFLHVYKKGGGL
ncbi:class I SAM-dependent methyltransferase [Deferribacter autotrophicus]|uniref:Class I SAM-dependent methyltransferase n=1 Tax=Deferribacter autotrophicus TaxID=500465 RepID=A0A5A8F2E6_9BACT|nr:class I SAM-dependent methyltransferase [Deferribacter autotrophicus]KAA0257065.1 class I SAM-dependent methyltransferase [Deferribacter autotrophicus]